MLIRSRKGWERIPGLRLTPEEAYLDRRRFFRLAGLGSLSVLGLGRSAHARDGTQDGKEGPANERGEESGRKEKPGVYPAERNGKYTVERRLTPERFVTSYNNFYEFSFSKRGPKTLARRMQTSPWTVEVTGEVEKPRTLDVDDLLRRFPLEERLYRFRCVEAWAMTVPWTGFSLRSLIEHVKPLSSARFVRFVTFYEPKWGRGFRFTDYPWPYHEGLTIEEATNELTLLVTGLYGKPLPKQNGAPVRLIVPWKYGFKSIKSIVRIELVRKRPGTFWNTVVPAEYDFEANVDPAVPHPRWSQARERLIDTGETVPTRLYNGYEEFVAHLYGKKKSSSR